jgi:hypothetical protein
MARVSDEVLASVCKIVATTDMPPDDRPLPDDATYGDSLRACALDLRDARAEIAVLKARAERAEAALVAAWFTRSARPSRSVRGRARDP